jgi:DNA polymerase-3 subunit gamma/tau
MGQALYRTHRPKKLAEVIGQEHITKPLVHTLKKGTISHAYLFTGPRGVGKTSIARILAHEINGLPYEDDANHLDIIEIDAASNRRIDEIRDLRDKVHIAPTSAKYKVYIIDEVHMLTREAFNALLKTLEEPPAHVIFILATTEVHKLPETIISRTQRFAFKPVDLPKVVDHLRSIATTEKIDIADDALELIAAHGEGSFRDSISLLDQIRNRDKKVTLADVQATLGIAPAEVISSIITALSTHDAVAIAESLQHIQNQGYEAAQVAKQLGQALRQKLLSGEASLPHEQLMKLLAQLIEVPASHDPSIFLEIILLDAALTGVATTPAAPSTPIPTAKPKPAPHSSTKVMSEEVQTKPASVTAEHPSSFKKVVPPPIEDDDPEEPDIEPNSTVVLDEAVWGQVLATVKQKYNTLFSIARTAHPHFTPGKLTLEFGFAFHQRRINEKKNKEIIAKCLEQLTGEPIQISCIVTEGKPAATTAVAPPPLPTGEGEQVHAVKAAPATPPTPAAPPNEAVASISNIFGGAEVLES